jgi:hypothetical protein
MPSGILCRVISQTNFSDVLTASVINLIMEAEGNSETSVCFCEATRRNISEVCILHTAVVIKKSDMNYANLAIFSLNFQVIIVSIPDNFFLS